MDGIVEISESGPAIEPAQSRDRPNMAVFHYKCRANRLPLLLVGSNCNLGLESHNSMNGYLGVVPGSTLLKSVKLLELGLLQTLFWPGDIEILFCGVIYRYGLK